jgi:hypothetical protein
MRLAALLACAVMAGCASTSGSAKKEVASAAETDGGRAESTRLVQGQGENGSETFVDREEGFQIERPGASWDFKPGRALSTESITVPLVISSEEDSAQVIVQIAPAVATPNQFAQRLSVGLRARAGFSISEVVPIPLADGAVGFDFRVQDQVHGRVAILEGTPGRIFVLLATWPQDAPASVENDIDHILSSMRTVEQ